MFSLNVKGNPKRHLNMGFRQGSCLSLQIVKQEVFGLIVSDDTGPWFPSLWNSAVGPGDFSCLSQLLYFRIWNMRELYPVHCSHSQGGTVQGVRETRASHHPSFKSCFCSALAVWPQQRTSLAPMFSFVKWCWHVLRQYCGDLWVILTSTQSSS